MHVRTKICTSPQGRQREARARKQRMLEMEVEAKKKALKSDIEARISPAVL